MVNLYEDMRKSIGPVTTYYLFYKKIGLYLQKFMITERFWFFFFWMVEQLFIDICYIE